MDLGEGRVSGPGKQESVWVTLTGRRNAIKPSMRDCSDGYSGTIAQRVYWYADMHMSRDL